MMASEKRHEDRYQRRKARRLKNLIDRNAAVGGLEQVFNYRDMFKCGKICCNGVRWKNSAQRFEMHLFSITARQRRQILDKTWKAKPYVHFMLRERGKIRPIDAPHIHDRQVHKVWVQNALYPLYLPSMIYDNGASQKGKGLHFSYRRLKENLRDYCRKNGNNGYVVLVDLTGFFPNAPRDVIKARHERLILDPDLREFADLIVDSSPGDKGMPLGVEPSQLEMVSLPSAVDNYLRCQRGLNTASHYMDDYHSIVKTRAEGKALLGDMTARFAENGMTVSKHKSLVAPISHFKYCKATFLVSDTGRVTTHGSRDSMKRARRKIKFMDRQERDGKITRKESDEWFTTVTAYYRGYDDHKRVLKLNRIRHAVRKGGS